MNRTWCAAARMRRLSKGYIARVISRLGTIPHLQATFQALRAVSLTCEKGLKEKIE